MNKKNDTGVFVATLLSVCLLSAAQAADAPAQTPISIETFQGARILHGPGSYIYPMTEAKGGHEGWVVLNMMIDPKGKPYEVMVLDSSGNPAFEKAALRAVNSVTFQPAERDKTPIDSSFTFKMKFAMSELQTGASVAFASAYRRFAKATQAGDKAKADVELAKLQPENLYEEAFANFGKFYYHRQWGTPAEQWEDLQRAIAGEEKPVYLPKDSFAIALYAKFGLEVSASDFGRALETWHILDPLATPEMRKALQPTVDQLRAAQSGTQPVRQRGVIRNSYGWETLLYRNKFIISVINGAVSEIKLRCAQKYLFFRYQPDLVYSIGSNADRCSIQVVGDEGTTFELLQ
jgi:TonB family protein